VDSVRSDVRELGGLDFSSFGEGPLSDSYEHDVFSINIEAGNNLTSRETTGSARNFRQHGFHCLLVGWLITNHGRPAH
jgi:hypothetical protein